LFSDYVKVFDRDRAVFDAINYANFEEIMQELETCDARSRFGFDDRFVLGTVGVGLE
jgi:hypothetical protein